eukprot:297625_1
MYVTGIWLFGLYVMDNVSNILFTYEVYQHISNDMHFVLFIACIVAVVIPYIISFPIFFKFQDLWSEDPAIGAALKGWNREKSTMLLAASVIAGCPYAACVLFNSRVIIKVLGSITFCMGLSYRHLRPYEAINSRITIFKNFPLLIIQIVFISDTGSVTEIFLLAAISSWILTIITVIDMWNSKRLELNSGIDGYETLIKVPVISPEVGEHQWQYRLKTHRFNELFAKIIGIDKYDIEVDLPTPNKNGLVINFFCQTIHISPVNIRDSMVRAQKNGAMVKFIQEAWQLERTPLLGRIEFEQISANSENIANENDVHVGTENINPLHADGIKIESDIIEENMDTDVNSRRGSTFKAKPYENVSKMVKANISRMKRESIQQDRSKQIMGVEMTETVNINRDIPENVHIRSSEVKSLLPQQPTGAHTKKMIDMEMNGIPIINKSNEITKKVSKNPISDQGQIIKHMIGNDPQTQFRKHIQEHGISPSSPELYGWRDSNNIHQIGMQQQFQQQAQSNYNQYGGYAVSAINLNQNNNYNNYQTNYKHVQNRYNNDIMTDDTDHIGFIPPAPQNEINKYLEYKQKRQARDEEKKLRKQWLTSYNMDNNSGIQFTPNIGSNIQSETDKIEKVVN